MHTPVRNPKQTMPAAVALLLAALAGCGAMDVDSANRTADPGGSGGTGAPLNPGQSGGSGGSGGSGAPGSFGNVGVSGAQDFAVFRRALDQGLIPSRDSIDAAGFFA